MSARSNNHPPTLTHAERFAQLARELECDEDDARWDERLKKVAKVTPKPADPSEP